MRKGDLRVLLELEIEGLAWVGDPILGPAIRRSTSAQIHIGDFGVDPTRGEIALAQRGLWAFLKDAINATYIMEVFRYRFSNFHLFHIQKGGGWRMEDL